MLNQGRIKDIAIEQEMKDSYLSYAMSVIISRALPDVRDGLKPSQRRILVAMNDMSLTPRAHFRKCAKICGDTSGNYHPHGEMVVYPTLVRLAQEFNMRYPLIEGQGNFGSIDGDPPAAMRYTEARMRSSSVEMMEDLKSDTVDFVPNYDETRQEPVVLPAKFPNLVVNGANGIAVGMATSIPPHNLVETANAIIKLIDSPDIAVEELINVLPGPDFPTGGTVCGKHIKEAYRTGRGQIYVRGIATPEVNPRSGKKSIVVTEIPYQITKTRIIERIAFLVKSNVLKGVSDVRDESDRDGMRLVIELKRGEDEKTVINQLYKHTPLQDTFSVNMIALVDGRPRTMNIKELMQEFINHRFVVITRRTQFLLDRAQERKHIVDGLVTAVDNIDKVIKIIRSSETTAQAADRLMSEFNLTKIQADAILSMQLSRLVGLEREKLQEERKQLRDKIKDCWMILTDKNRVYDIIREDIYEMREKYSDGRRTKIVDNFEDITEEQLIAEESVVVTVSHQGYIKQSPLFLYRRQQRGGKGLTGADIKEEDFAEHIFVASTHDYLLFFTDAGKVHWLKVYDVPRMGRVSRGRAIINILEIPKEEAITSMIPVRNFDDRYLLLVTEKGIVKKTVLSAYGRPKKGGIIAIDLDKGDKLIGAALTHGNDHIVLGTENGFAIRFSETGARSMGRATHGVRGIRLRKGDKVKSLVLVAPDSTLLSVCANGFGKRTSFKEYRIQSRGGMGIINIKANKRNGNVVGLMSVHDDDEVVVITIQGKMIRISAKPIRLVSRNTQGVTLIKLDKGDRIGSIARVAKEDVQKEKENREEKQDMETELMETPEPLDMEQSEEEPEEELKEADSEEEEE
ncbi:MAG: DNA gyrase subunit A [Planctomycetota bacterium]